MTTAVDNPSTRPPVSPPPYITSGTPVDPPTPPVSDFDVIAPAVGRVVVAGHKCRVRRLKTLEVMSLLRVVTSGMGDSISALRMDEDADFGAQFVGLLVISIPNAPDEMIRFIRAVVEPVDTLTDEQRAEFDRELTNPELDVLMDIAAKVVEQEKDDMAALLGKARTMLAHLSALYRTGRKDS